MDISPVCKIDLTGSRSNMYRRGLHGYESATSGDVLAPSALSGVPTLHIPLLPIASSSRPSAPRMHKIGFKAACQVGGWNEDDAPWKPQAGLDVMDPDTNLEPRGQGAWAYSPPVCRVGLPSTSVHSTHAIIAAFNLCASTEPLARPGAGA